MNERDFCFWLKGLLDNKESISDEDVKLIKNHLSETISYSMIDQANNNHEHYNGDLRNMVFKRNIPVYDCTHVHTSDPALDEKQQGKV